VSRRNWILTESRTCYCRPEEEDRERGAVIPLVALLLTVFLIFAAIVVDMNLLASSREQTQHYARLAALAAINGHFSSPSADINVQVAAALAAAQRVSDSNLILSDQVGPTAQAQLSSLEGSDGAFLEPGVWYFSDNGDDPCELIGNGEYPCFDPTDLSSADPLITAYRITGSLYQGITTAIASRLNFLGNDVFDVDVTAVASVVPRHGCFIIDLSGSMVRDTHLGRITSEQADEPTEGRGREWAFLLEGDNPSVPEDYFHTQHYNFLCTGEARPSEKTTTPAAICTSQTRPTDTSEWDTFLAPFGRTFASLTEQERRRIHFHDDYVLKKTLGNKHWAIGSDYSNRHPNPADATRYLVSDTTDDGRYYRVNVDPLMQNGGPEPLKTVFAGLNEAMRTFRDRRVAGDEACLIFYDENAAWPRVVNLTDDFDYLVRLTDFSSPTPIAADLASISDTDLTASTTSGLELIIRHGLFPAGPDAARTNTGLAISEAMGQLTTGNSEGGFSADFIVAIGDGLGNCAYCDTLEGGGRIPGCVEGCNNDYDYYSGAQDSLLEFVSSEIVPRNIPIHQILVGQSVAPHTLDITSEEDGSEGACMDDLEFRRTASGESFVKGGFDSGTFSDISDAFRNATADNPFYEASVPPYEIAASTRGLWGPVRPSPAGCTPITSCTGSVDDLANAPRITQDPKCRTTEEQIQEYMGQIIGDNPYTLVYVGPKG